MEPAFGRLHNSGPGAFGARPTVVECIMMDGKAANIAIQTIPNDDLKQYPYPIQTTFLVFQIRGCDWVWVLFISFSLFCSVLW